MFLRPKKDNILSNYFLISLLLYDSKLNVFSLKNVTFDDIVLSFWKLWSTFFTIFEYFWTKQLAEWSRKYLMDNRLDKKKRYLLPEVLHMVWLTPHYFFSSNFIQLYNIL